MVALDFRLAHGFRSGLEEKVSEQLAFLNILDCYEITKIPFLQPERHRNYTPDFLLPFFDPVPFFEPFLNFI